MHISATGKTSVLTTCVRKAGSGHLHNCNKDKVQGHKKTLPWSDKGMISLVIFILYAKISLYYSTNFVRSIKIKIWNAVYREKQATHTKFLFWNPIRRLHTLELRIILQYVPICGIIQWHSIKLLCYRRTETDGSAHRDEWKCTLSLHVQLLFEIFWQVPVKFRWGRETFVNGNFLFSTKPLEMFLR